MPGMNIIARCCSRCSACLPHSVPYRWTLTITGATPCLGCLPPLTTGSTQMVQEPDTDPNGVFTLKWFSGWNLPAWKSCVWTSEAIGTTGPVIRNFNTGDCSGAWNDLECDPGFAALRVDYIDIGGTWEGIAILFLGWGITATPYYAGGYWAVDPVGGAIDGTNLTAVRRCGVWTADNVLACTDGMVTRDAPIDSPNNILSVYTGGSATLEKGPICG